MKYIKIRGDEKKVLRSTYKEMRRILSPLLDSTRFKDLRIYWWKKPITSKRGFSAGKCYWNSKTIYLWYEYYKRNGVQDLVSTFQHEVIHLIEHHHTSRFKSLLKEVGSTRFAADIKSEPGEQHE